MVVFAGADVHQRRGSRWSFPALEATFTVSEVFAFTSVLLFGPEAGAVTLALDSLVLAWHRRMTPDKAAFNFGNLTLAVWVVRHAVLPRRRARRRCSATAARRPG